MSSTQRDSQSSLTQSSNQFQSYSSSTDRHESSRTEQNHNKSSSSYRESSRHESHGTDSHGSRSERPEASHHHEESNDTETTPLLDSQNDEGYDDDDDVEDQSRDLGQRGQPRSAGSQLASYLRRTRISKQTLAKRWPSFLALAVLCILVVFIIVGAFVVPAIVKEYAQDAYYFNASSLSVDTFSPEGAYVRIQGLASVDSSRVRKKSVRDVGKFFTHIAEWAETSASTVKVSLPEYGGIVVAEADVPPIKVNLRDGHNTLLDFLAEVKPGSKEGIRRVAEDFIAGSLDQLKLRGSTDIKLRSGVISLAAQKLIQDINLKTGDVPTIPRHNITRLIINEDPDSGTGERGLKGEATVRVENPFPVEFTIPSLGFKVLAPNCGPSDPYINLADATTDLVHVRPKSWFRANLSARIQKLSDDMVKACPESHPSPLDALLEDYLHGQETTFYVRGSDVPSHHTPHWLTELISGITVPVPFPGRELGNLIKEFKLSNVTFDLPEFFAPPDSPGANPKITADIKALIRLPDEINFPIDVHRVRTTANIYFKGDKLGYLDLKEWQNATSKRIDNGKESSGLRVDSHLQKAPIVVTDSDVFTDVLSAILTSKKTVTMDIKADVDVEVTSPLRKLVVKKIPATGTVPVKPISDHNVQAFSPRIGGLRISDTTARSMQLDALVNFTNPSPYSASIPYADVHILVNGTKLGHGIVENIFIGPGNNTNIPVRATWEPYALSGKEGAAVGRELLSQYISGYNTTLTIKTYRGSLPALPSLGEALSKFEVNVTAPRIGDSDDSPDDDPDDEDGDGKRRGFLRGTTFHLFSSTASFILYSPVKETIIFLTSMAATAYYRGDNVGQIIYDEPLAIEPGFTETPRLPVLWDLDSVGYDAISDALGGSLKLEAKANATVQIGKFVETVWYEGHSIGAKIRL